MEEKKEKSKERKILDMLEFEAVGEHRSSFNLKSTSRGTTVEVKVYSGDSDADVVHARELAEQHFDELRTKYKPVEELG